MSQRASGYARRRDEEYPTPDWVAGVIAEYLKKRALTIWEPAAGHAALAIALEAYGFRVHATADDFFGYVDAGGYDAIVTNPPYGEDRRGKVATDFIRHALSLKSAPTSGKPPPIVCMLLPIDFDSAKTRTDLFRDNRHWYEKIVLLNRVKWFEGPSSPSVNHAWYVWNPNYIRAGARISYAERPNGDPA